MPKKLKFKPVITRIKLNPEQAVLSCCEQIGKGVSFAPCGYPTQQCIAASCGHSGNDPSS